MSSRRSGFLLVLLSAACFGFLPTTLRSIYATSSFEPVDVAVWRYLLAVPMVLAFAAYRRYRPGEKAKISPLTQRAIPVKHLLILGISYAFAVTLAFFALERLPVAIFMLLLYTYPALVAIMSVFSGAHLSNAGWLALALTLTGAALTIGDFSAGKGLDIIGIALGIFESVSVAIYYVLSDKLLRGSGDHVRNTSWILSGTLMALLVLVLFFGLKMPQQAATWLGLFILSGICTGLPIFALNAGIQRIGSTQAGIVSSLELVFSITLAFLILGETVLPVQLLGICLIISAVVLLQLRPGNAAAKPGV